jgi:RNA polymerase sigma-70 factor (ECF subfamily)
MNVPAHKDKHTETDLVLIQQSKNGDLVAFEELVRRYQRQIYRVAYRFVHNSADAEDMAQETFIHAFTAIKSFKEEFRFYTWIYRIAVNLCLNFSRRHRRIFSSRLEDVSPEYVVAPERQNPEKVMARTEMGEKIQRAVNRLPGPQKTVFILRAYEELSYEEIAQVLKISTGTVMSRLARARAKLQAYLKEAKHALQ